MEPNVLDELVSKFGVLWMLFLIAAVVMVRVSKRDSVRKSR